MDTTCQHCGGQSVARRSTRRYCSDNCRNLAFQAKESAAARAALTCKHCGATFEDTPKGPRCKYCSNSCRKAAERIRKQARRAAAQLRKRAEDAEETEEAPP